MFKTLVRQPIHNREIMLHLLFESTAIFEAKFKRLNYNINKMIWTGPHSTEVITISAPSARTAREDHQLFLYVLIFCEG